MVVSVLLTAELYPGPTLLLSDEELLESEPPPGPSDIPGATVVTRSAPFLLIEALGPSSFTLELLPEVFPGASKLTLDLLAEPAFPEVPMPEELLLVELLLEAPVPGPVRLTPELELPELLELPGPLLLVLLELLEFEFPDTPGPVKLVSEELLPADPLTPGPPEE